MAVKLVATLVLIVLLIGALFLAYGVLVEIKMQEVAELSPESDVWLRLKAINTGYLNISDIGFGCNMMAAQDRAGLALMQRPKHLGMLIARPGPSLNRGESLEVLCFNNGAIPAAKVYEAEFRVFAMFEVRFLPLSGSRTYTVRAKMDEGQSRLRVISINE
jgi:hypothetical protein